MYHPEMPPKEELIMFNVQSHNSFSSICFAVGGSDKVEVKGKLTKIETMGQQVQGEKTVYQQGAF